MRKLDPKFGRIGFTLRIMGTSLAWVAHAPLDSRPLVSFVMMIFGSMMYMAGGFLAVAALGYSRQSPLFWGFTTLRLAFAAAVILLLMRFATPG